MGRGGQRAADQRRRQRRAPDASAPSTASGAACAATAGPSGRAAWKSASRRGEPPEHAGVGRSVLDEAIEHALGGQPPHPHDVIDHGAVPAEREPSVDARG